MLKARIIDYTLNACDAYHRPVFLVTLRLGRKITFNVNARFFYVPANLKLPEDLGSCYEILELIVFDRDIAELLRNVTHLVSADCYHYHKFAQKVTPEVSYFYFATIRPLI